MQDSSSKSIASTGHGTPHALFSLALVQCHASSHRTCLKHFVVIELLCTALAAKVLALTGHKNFDMLKPSLRSPAARSGQKRSKASRSLVV